MQSTDQAEPPIWPVLAWLTVVLAGVAAPALATLLIPNAPEAAGLILAVGLMGTGMIGAAVSGRLWLGVLLALLSGAVLLAVSLVAGLPVSPNLLLVAPAALIASVSFAARGALFAVSAGNKGWWVAFFVVAGEAAIVATAASDPDLLPDWLLMLLPAQWASIAIETALGGALTPVAIAAMIALAGTAAATLLVRHLWPRRWTYAIMFTTWLALSALVYHQL